MLVDTETISKEFGNGLKRFIFGRVSDHMAAEDILQDVYVKIHSRIQTLDDESKLEAWLYQIARNAIIDYYRQQKPTTELDEAAAVPEKLPEKEAWQDLASSIGNSIMSLPDKYREALILSELEGISHREIAERLGISLSAAKSRVQRARQLLKEAILDCCHLEMDRQGRIFDYAPNCRCCADEQGPENCETVRSPHAKARSR